MMIKIKNNNWKTKKIKNKRMILKMMIKKQNNYLNNYLLLIKMIL